MSVTDKISGKEIIIALVVLAVFGSAMMYTLSIFNSESAQSVADISRLGDNEPTHVATHLKVVSVDPVKSDVSIRIEFEPSGSLLADDGTLNRGLRLFLNSAAGKQEIEFVKGKLMSPVEAVFNMRDGQSTQYPYDRYNADIDLYITGAKPVTGKTTDTSPAATNSTIGGTTMPDTEPNELPVSVDFLGSIPGFKIDAIKEMHTSVDFVRMETHIGRSGTVKFVSVFVSALTWALTIGILFLVVSLLIRGRKVEIEMLSLMGAMLFGFYAIRNSQPNIPPIGVYSDFVSYIWCEVIIGGCLALCLGTWVLRPSK